MAGLGILFGFIGAYYYGKKSPAEAPAFTPAADPYTKGIYANGMIESYQTNGENININPDVSGTVTAIYVTEGQQVHQNDPIFKIDDSVQKSITEQQKSQAEAAKALLDELKAQPRKETLAVAKAQMDAAQSTLKNVEDQLSKQKTSYRLNPHSVSLNELDNAINAVRIMNANFEVAQKQYSLIRAGAWSYDITNQEKTYNSLKNAYLSSNALLDKYVVKAVTDGVVLSIQFSVGSYLSAQGAYGSYTQNFSPAVVMGGVDSTLQVRVYVDEILVNRLPEARQMRAQMFIRGTTVSAPLEFVRIQPFVSPKIELSVQRQEQVDVRVLPIIFKFTKAENTRIYPGQIVSVFISERSDDEQIARVERKK